MTALLLAGAKVMSAAEFEATVMPFRVKVASHKTNFTDWAALSPSKQAHDALKEAA